eukprot:TRINITY_DN59731_c0_g1_i2.p1 TRINITY_DN59731_c0_g1~~TRINITY_DN59731_c0_g1_i2.p1  ORF type:complete len:528 (-),score=43.92 TRINITY_DN59731_c0_g1_i2:686-2248(-)
MNMYKSIQTRCGVDELNVNGTFLAKVRCQDEHNQWGEWTELPFETPPPPPGRPVLRKALANSIAFAWDPPDSSCEYTYCIEMAIIKPGPAAKGKKGKGPIKPGARSPARSTSGSRSPRKSSYRSPTLASTGGKTKNGKGKTKSPPPRGRSRTLSTSAKGPDGRPGSQGKGKKLSEENLHWKVVDTVAENQIRCKVTTALSKMRFRVKAVKTKSMMQLWSNYSPIAAFTVTTPPDPPQSLIITSLTKNAATVEWQRPPNFRQHPKLQYKVYLAERDSTLQLVNNTKSMRYELSGLRPNTHYRVSVHAESDNGVSMKNLILRFSTKTEGGEGGSGMGARGRILDPSGGSEHLPSLKRGRGRGRSASSGRGRSSSPSRSGSRGRGKPRGTSPRAKSRSTSGGKKAAKKPPTHPGSGGAPPLEPKPPSEPPAGRSSRSGSLGSNSGLPATGHVPRPPAGAPSEGSSRPKPEAGDPADSKSESSASVVPSLPPLGASGSASGGYEGVVSFDPSDDDGSAEEEEEE